MHAHSWIYLLTDVSRSFCLLQKSREAWPLDLFILNTERIEVSIEVDKDSSSIPYSMVKCAQRASSAHKKSKGLSHFAGIATRNYTRGALELETKDG